MAPVSMARPGCQIDMSKWKKLDSWKLGLSRSMISQSSWIVLKILWGEGFEAYLVGGCVRDLILNRIPKDFDVITTAKLTQVKKLFHRAIIVGQQFPICLVRIKGAVVEVSSFDTAASSATEKEVLKDHSLQMPRGFDEKDFIRWKDSKNRDFTINSLFFDPFNYKIYDYVNGMADLRSLKLQTLIPARSAFHEDCARILRGIRIAARLGLSLSEDTETAIRDFSSSVQFLTKDRIMLELNYMLSYGAAVPSLRLLHRFNLLEFFLPFQAAYLKEAKESVKSPNMFMKLFFHLDKVVSCDRPSHCSLWIGLLAFHMALVKKPREALVIWTFASVLYHGNWEKGVKFAKEHARMQVNFVPEISESSDFKSDEELAVGVSRFASSVRHSIAALARRESIYELIMCRYPNSPCSDFVLISKKRWQLVAEIFRMSLLHDIESYHFGRENFEIDYQLLRKGDLRETRFVLGKIILETMSGAAVPEKNRHLVHSHTLKNQVLNNRKLKQGLSTSHPKPKHDMVEKHKLFRKKTILSKPEVKEVYVDDKNCKDNVETHLKVVEKAKSMLSQDRITQKHEVVVSQSVSEEGIRV